MRSCAHFGVKGVVVQDAALLAPNRFAKKSAIDAKKPFFSSFPESVKSELAKINKRQDDIIRFIRHYEEEQLNPMIRATNSIALRFDAIGKTLETLILSQLETSQERQTAVLKKLSEQFCNHADVINNQSKQINALYQIHQRDYKKLIQLIQLYSELSACGVMDSKRKENLKTKISNLINT